MESARKAQNLLRSSYSLKRSDKENTKRIYLRIYLPSTQYSGVIDTGSFSMMKPTTAAKDPITLARQL